MPSAAAPGECVKVVTRCRPLSETEVKDNRQCVVQLVNPTTLKVAAPKGDQTFLFEKAYGPGSSQDEVFQTTARPIVDSVLEGYNGTIFAYGQTGSGKTYTMEGSDEQPGIIPRTFEYLASRMSEVSASSGREYVVYLSFLEIYNEEIRDLLATKQQQQAKLEIKESKEKGMYVAGLGQHVVTGVQEMARKLQLGKRNRSVGSTKMNAESSRSHSILTLTVVGVDKEAADDVAAAAAAAVAPRPAPGTKPTPSKASASGRVCVGKLHLVDLAGSERQDKTGAAGERLKEAVSINKSLSALGNVMSCLSDGKAGAHVPYRDSKLTRLLQDSLGGNTKTVMVANVGPADYNCDETLSTLRYAARARNIRNVPHVNNDPADAIVKQYREEVDKLRAEYQERISRMEAAHAEEVAKLKAEMEDLQAQKARKAADPGEMTLLKAQLQQLMEEQQRRAAEEAEAAELKKQLDSLQQQMSAEQQQQQAALAAAQAAANQAAAAAATTAASVAAAKYQKEMRKLKDKLATVQKEALSDYQHLVEQQDELARLRARLLVEAGQRAQQDGELQRLRQELEGAAAAAGSKPSPEQQAELQRLQALVESLQARDVRPRTAHIGVNLIVQDPSTGSSMRGGNGRSLREDLGCNMLFEQLVLEMGYDAEASRQAIMANPGGTLDEIVDYIMDREAIFVAWRRLKASLAAGAAQRA
mmetsp:Transcript_20257/g.44229  ORF Transcript_20257/g.44229 Transcript_20257/m.44229 type:complete len:701 (+) Transcript_20257:74-2176(+)